MKTDDVSKAYNPFTSKYKKSKWMTLSLGKCLSAFKIREAGRLQHRKSSAITKAFDTTNDNKLNADTLNLFVVGASLGIQWIKSGQKATKLSENN